MSKGLRRFGFLALVLMPILVVGLIALAARKIETRVLWANTDSADAYRAALTYVRSAPEASGATNFSQQKDTTVERWGPTRWRVAGYLDAQKSPGAKVHTFYTCVLRYSGHALWEVEDMHFERIE